MRYCEITSRTKTLESFKNKVVRKNIKNLDEVDDLSGIRVIGFFDDDIEKIKQAIYDDETINVLNTDDKVKESGTNLFGYKAIHVTCSFQDSFVEYSVYKGLKFEIQIRTIFQHAWAQFSHDQNYKVIDIMPKYMVRNFNRLQAFVEVIEENFKGMFKEAEQLISDYKKQFDVIVKDKPPLAHSLIALKFCKEIGFKTDIATVNMIQEKLFKTTFTPEELGRWIIKSNGSWEFPDDAALTAIAYSDNIKARMIDCVSDQVLLKMIQEQKLIAQFGSFYGNHVIKLDEKSLPTGISEIFSQSQDFREKFGRSIGDRFSSLSSDTQKYLLTLARQFEDFGNMLGWGIGLNILQLSPEMQEEVWKLAEDSKHAAYWIIYNFMLYNSIDRLGRKLQHRILAICEKDVNLLNWAAYFFGWHFHTFDPIMQEEILSIADQNSEFCRSLLFLMVGGGKFYTLRESLQEKLWKIAYSNEEIAGQLGRHIIAGVDFFDGLDETSKERILKFVDKSEAFARGVGFAFSEVIQDLSTDKQEEVMKLVESNENFADGFFFHLAYNLKEYLRPFYERYKNNTGKMVYTKIIGLDGKPIIRAVE